MSCLQDPRVLFAAERTLLAWQRSSISLMAFGFVVERFGLFLRMLAGQGLQSMTGEQRVFSQWVGILLILLGATTAALSAIQHRKVLRALQAEEFPRGYWTTPGVWLNAAIAALGVVLAAHFALS